MRDKGIFDGLFTEEELVSDNVKGKKKYTEMLSIKIKPNLQIQGSSLQTRLKCNAIILLRYSYEIFS